MKEKYISINNLKVSEILFNFVNDELLKDTKIAKEDFWKGFDKAVHELAPINKDLLKKRDIIQKQIDEWHIKIKATKLI
jgi:malate synthase